MNKKLAIFTSIILIVIISLVFNIVSGQSNSSELYKNLVNFITNNSDQEELGKYEIPLGEYEAPIVDETTGPELIKNFPTGKADFSKITWLPKEEKISSLDIYIEHSVYGQIEDISPEKSTSTNPNHEYGYFKTGTTDTGMDVIHVIRPTMSYTAGPGSQIEIDTLLKSNSQIYLVSSGTYSKEYNKFLINYLDPSKVVLDDESDVYKDVKKTPAKLTMTFGELTSLEYYQQIFFSKIHNAQLVGKSKEGYEVYTGKLIKEGGGFWQTLNKDGDYIDNGAYYVKSPDNFIWQYKYEPEFATRDTTNWTLIPKITWLDGTKNKMEYSMTDIGGCGSMNLASVVTDFVSKNELDIAGKNSSGEDIFVLKDPKNNSFFKEFINVKFPDGIKIYIPDPNKNWEDQFKSITLDEYLASKPLFFWYDPTGRLIKFESMQFTPPAECGKPVIYLYPETPMNISVKVSPKGGFTYTEPKYEGSWEVFADTESNITELATGKTYPYLFWEGRGDQYETPKQGFVVKQADIEKTIRESLSKFGFIDKEIADFLEFWLPKMQSKPFYFITFMGNETMDQIAPLDITPTPDTVIRVLMDYEGLDEFKKVQPIKIQNTQRKGFTVTEWGGVLGN